MSSASGSGPPPGRGVHCHYCEAIAAADPSYAGREAEFDLGSQAPRCAWHWRFVCDCCRQPGHFMTRFFCPTSGRLLCREAGEVSVEWGRFWAWDMWWILRCADCSGSHPSLDYAEFLGTHPWQTDPAAAALRRWLSVEPHLVRYPRPQPTRVPMETLSDADLDAAWSANADVWHAGYDERGDRNRKYRSDPVLLAMLGDVAGQRVLDAGSGNGYLARMLARRGARVVAVENARRLYEIAVAEEARRPLGIEPHHASISSMPFLADGSFDAAVANYVLMDVRDYEAAIAEVARVLRRGGRFVAAISFGTADARWHVVAPDSPRREDRLGWMIDDYFVRRAVVVQWGQLKPFVSFHRPLRDYVAAARRAGLELRDLDEPEWTPEAERDLPASVVREWQRIPYATVLKWVRT